VTRLVQSGLSQDTISESSNPFQDDTQIVPILKPSSTSDFVSVAFRWLGESGEKLSPENKKPEILLPMLVNYLRENRVPVLIDSLEKPLTVNDTENRSNFADEWWEKFFLNILAAESCQGRIIVTSQDLPVTAIFDQTRHKA
jgi:hypothetical protein